MEFLSLLMNAKILSEDGDELADIVAIHIQDGKLFLFTSMELSGEQGPDDGEEEPAPASVQRIRAIAGEDYANG